MLLQPSNWTGCQAGASTHPVPGSGLWVFGERGQLVWDWTRPGRILRGLAGEQELEEIGRPPEFDLAKAFPHAREFVDAIRAGRPACPDFSSGVAELALVEACERSVSTGAWQELG